MSTNPTLVDLYPFLCPLDSCNEAFATKIDLYTHKRNSDHFWCDECDVLSDNFKDHLEHLTTATNDAGKKIHIACEKCGKITQSQGGMDAHMKYQHREAQSLKCLGCKKVFPSASSLVGHLERGACYNRKCPSQAITSEQFRDNVNHLNIINRLLSKGTSNTNTWVPASHSPATTNKSRRDFDLMSANYTAQPGGVSGFQPVLGSDWPSVASKSLSTDSTGGDNPFDWSPPVKASTTTTKPDLDLGNTAKVLPLTTHNLKKKGGSTKRPKAAPLVCYTDSDCGSSSSSEDPETADTSLDTFDASMELVNLSSTDEKDQPMPHPGGLAKPASNDFNTRFWKPSSNEWDDSKLYNPILEAYECPHLDCRYTQVDPKTFKEHCFDQHVPSIYRCPYCLKEFKSLQSLVGHCESPNRRCRIANTRTYGEFMHRLTGGYIDATKRNAKGTIVYRATLPSQSHTAILPVERVAKPREVFW